MNKKIITNNNVFMLVTQSAEVYGALKNHYFEFSNVQTNDRNFVFNGSMKARIQDMQKPNPYISYMECPFHHQRPGEIIDSMNRLIEYSANRRLFIHTCHPILLTDVLLENLFLASSTGVYKGTDLDKDILEHYNPASLYQAEETIFGFIEAHRELEKQHNENLQHNQNNENLPHDPS